jgi:hypothetical protein
MTTRFGSGLFVIPNSFRDLRFWFREFRDPSAPIDGLKVTQLKLKHAVGFPVEEL